jgi:hypothetical protein
MCFSKTTCFWEGGGVSSVIAIVTREIGNAFAVGCSIPYQIEISPQTFTSQYNFLICIGGAWD